MRDSTLAYPGSVNRTYARLRRHRRFDDAAPAAVLVIGSVVFSSNLAVLPATLALAGAVAARRRFLVPAYIAALTVGAAQVIVGIGSGPFSGNPLRPTFADAGILMLLYTLASRRPRRVSLWGLAACVMLFALAVVQLQSGEPVTQPLQFVFLTIPFYVLAPVSAWVLGESMARRRVYLAALEERAVRAEAERDARARAAAADERARIARELHDVIAHNLSVMVAQADGGRYVFDSAPEKSRQALTEIGATGRQALSEMSHLLGVLRADPAAPEFAPSPGVAEIPELVAQAREAGMRVNQTVEGAALPVIGGLSVAAYRIVQEALTNVRKHAGPGAAAEVLLRYGTDELVVRITDDGRGAVSRASWPDAQSAGHGLAGMRERAAIYGGMVRTGPRPGGGFEVTARLPLRVAAGPPASSPPASSPPASGATARDVA
jgi:signal transduction histidine kinase